MGIALPYMDALYHVVALQAYIWLQWRGAGHICRTLGKYQALWGECKETATLE